LAGGGLWVGSGLGAFPQSLIKFDRGAVLIVGEDPNRHRFSRSRELGELVGNSVELPAQVYETQAVKFLLGATNRCAVDNHPRVMAYIVAIHLIDH
jgi:hypothetical protein